MTVTTTTNALDKPLGEVIFSSSETTTAQCYKEIATDIVHNKKNISQGVTVKIRSSYDSSYLAFGLVTRINNSTLDSIHKPSALGLSQRELENLQPQVYDLLRKELEICLFAHQEHSGDIVIYPPVKPMMVHDFVYLTTDNEVYELSSDISVVANLIKKNKHKPDLLFDLILKGFQLRNYNHDYLVKAAQELSLAFLDEIDVLMGVLKRISESAEKAKQSTYVPM